MPEEQIRAFFAHIRAVRDRWAQEVEGRIGYDFGNSLDVDDGITNDSIQFEYHSFDGGCETNEIPLLAFVDFDAAAIPEIARRKAKRDADETERRQRQERKDRAEFERLKTKYGG